MMELRSTSEGRGRRIAALVVITLATTFLSGVRAMALDEEPPRLRFDPFRAPPASVAPGGAGRDRDEEPFRPVLRSVVVAGPRSLANLGGEILEVGDEANGYRLLDVRPFEALFEYQGRRVLLTVSKDEG